MSQVLIRRKAPTVYTYFAICPGGLDEVLKKEIEALPAKITHHYPGGVEFEGPLEMAYLACLELRTASRVLLRLQQTKKIFKDEELYEAVHAIDWTEVFDVDSTFSVYFTETRTKDRRGQTNTQFLALKAKDAIVDRFRKKFDRRPNVSRENPDVTIRLHWHDHILKIYLDLSGRSLHERGYRTETLEAPIKENLAAGLLLLADWPRLAAERVPFLDPFCGSGTLLIEALLIATRTAPGLFRTQFGFYSWKDHQPDLFDSVLERLKSKRVLDPAVLPRFLGSDQSEQAVAITRANLENAGFQSLVTLKATRFEDTAAPTPTGLIVANPPYGVRLNEINLLLETYQKMGSTLKHRYSGWQCGVISSDKKLLAAIGLRPRKKWNLHNGGLESTFSLFDLYKSEKMAK
jgi:23S rRNA (guanine2445-N2)-methyltransferase / 23S rRNA (guanine2069-N7)-methyltransferase